MDTKDTKVESTTDKTKDLAAKPADKGVAPVKTDPAKDTTMKAEQPAQNAASKGNSK